MLNWSEMTIMCYSKLLFDPLNKKDLYQVLDDNDENVTFNNHCSYQEFSNNVKYNNLSVIHLNVRSLMKKLSDIKHLVSVYNPSVLLLCETFLHKNNMSRVNIEGYDFYCENRTTGKGGGVCIYTKKSLNGKKIEIEKVPTNDIEQILVKISMEKKEIIVGELYRKPNTSEKIFINHLSKICTKLNTNKMEFILGTDQNIDLLKVENSNVNSLMEELYLNETIPVITKPTRVTYHTATLIDQIYISAKSFQNVESQIILDDTSDHLPCICIFKNKKNVKNHEVTFTGRNINDVNMSRLIDFLNCYKWENLNMFDTDTAYDTFLNVLNTGMNCFMPLKAITIKGKNVLNEKWITKSLLNCKNKSKKLFVKWKKSGKHCDEETYINYRNTLNRTKRHAKFMYYDNAFKETMNDSKKSWKLLNKLIGRTSDKSSIPDYIIANDKKIFNIKEMSNKFNHSFGGVGKAYAEKIPKPKKSFTEYLGEKRSTRFNFIPTSPADIAEILKSLKNKTSSGYDMLTNKFVKKLMIGICTPLSIIVNKSLNEGVMPSSLKKAEV